MKQNIFNKNLLLFIATTIFVACGEDPTIPQFNSRTIASGNIKVITFPQEVLGFNSMQETFLFNTDKKFYALGKLTEIEGEQLYDNKAFYEYNTETGGWQVAWYISDTHWPIADANIKRTRTELDGVEANIRQAKQNIADKEAEMEDVTEQRTAVQKQIDKLIPPIDPTELSRLYAEIERLNAKYNSLEVECSNLQNKIYEWEGEKNYLIYSVSEFVRAVYSIAIDSQSPHRCTYNGKGYILSRDNSNFFRQLVMLEFDSSTKEISVLTSDAANSSIQNIEYIFSTTKGIFGCNYNNQLYQFSFTTNQWEDLGMMKYNQYDISNFRMLSQSDKLYLMEGVGQKLSIKSINHPYTDVTNEILVDYPHDYGWDSSNSVDMSYYGGDIPFFMNGKLYKRMQDRAFYECNLTSNEVSLILLENVEHFIEYPLCVIGNKFYYASSQQIIEVTF